MSRQKKRTTKSSTTTKKKRVVRKTRGRKVTSSSSVRSSSNRRTGSTPSTTSTRRTRKTGVRKKTSSYLSSSKRSRNKNTGNVVSTRKKVPTESLEGLFSKYLEANEEEEDQMSGSSIIQFCEDLNIDPTCDVAILIIAWIIKAKTCYTFTREEFVGGLKKMRCKNLSDVKRNLSKWRSKINNKSSFREFYRYVFTFSVPSKSMTIDIAVPLWRMLFVNKPISYLDDLNIFLEKVHGKAISKDTWNQFHEFVMSAKPGFSNFDPNDCWPSVIDEFVEWYKDGKKLPDEKEKE